MKDPKNKVIAVVPLLTKGKLLTIERDKDGNIKPEILKELVDDIIAQNPLIYERLAQI